MYVFQKRENSMLMNEIRPKLKVPVKSDQAARVALLPGFTFGGIWWLLFLLGRVAGGARVGVCPLPGPRTGCRSITSVAGICVGVCCGLLGFPRSRIFRFALGSFWSWRWGLGRRWDYWRLGRLWGGVGGLLEPGLPPDAAITATHSPGNQGKQIIRLVRVC